MLAPLALITIDPEAGDATVPEWLLKLEPPPSTSITSMFPLEAADCTENCAEPSLADNVCTGIKFVVTNEIYNSLKKIYKNQLGNQYLNRMDWNQALYKHNKNQNKMVYDK